MKASSLIEIKYFFSPFYSKPSCCRSIVICGKASVDAPSLAVDVPSPAVDMPFCCKGLLGDFTRKHCASPQRKSTPKGIPTPKAMISAVEKATPALAFALKFPFPFPFPSHLKF